MTGTTAVRTAPSFRTLLDRRHRAVTVGIVAAMTLFAFEGMGVATAMPVVAADLGGLGSYTWAFSGFVMASLVGMVVAGSWADARGPRAPLLAGFAAFAAGAVVCGLSTSMASLVAGRLVSGVGSGFGVVCVYVVLGRGYEDLLRPKAFALLSAAWVVPSIVGPFVAGVLTDHVSWRAVFLAVVPVVVLPLALLAPRLDRLGGGTLGDDRTHGASRELRRHAGRRTVLAVVAAIGLGLLQEGATRPGREGVLLAVLGLVVLVPALRPLLPAGTMVARRGLPTVVLLRGLVAGAFFGGEAFIPLALQTVRGLDPAHAGLALTAGAIGWAAGSALQGRQHQVWGPGRLLALGTGASAVGLAAIPLAMLPGVTPYVCVLTWALAALGMGMTFGTLGNQTLTLSAPDEQGAGSAALQISDSVGSVLLIGVGGAIYAAAHAAGLVGAQTFTAIWWTMAAVMLLAVLLSPRAAPLAA